MANKQFNSVDGYSVGNASIVIDANRNVSGNLITATANVTAPQLISNVATGTAPLIVTSTTQVANLNVATAGTAGSATTAGTVTTNSQPNITSVGTLTSLSVTGNISGGNISTSNYITAGSINPVGNGKVSITNGIDPGTTPSALFVKVEGIGGGTAAPQYGIKVDANQTYNNSTAVYGVYSTAKHNTGKTSVGVYGQSGVLSSYAPGYGLYGQADFNSGAVHNYANGGLPVGVYGTTFNSTGTGNVATSAAGYFYNQSTSAATAYGVIIKTTSGPTNVIPLKIDNDTTELMRITGTGNVGIANNNPTHTLSVTGTMNVSGNANVGNIGATNFVGSGASLTNLNASNISSGTVPTARLGSGTANANTYLAGDNTWKTITSPSGAYVFTQSSPATTWVINHNLGVQYVNIQVIDSTGNSFTGRYNYPTITFNNTTHCTVTFDSAQAGYAAITSGGGEQGPAGPPSVVGGANTQVQFNDDGTANATSGFTFNKTTNTVTISNALSVTGNVTAGNFTGNLANGNSSVSIPSANGNVNISAVGNTTLVVTGVSANLTGTMFATGRYETAFQVLARSTSAVGNGYLDFNAGAASGNILIRDGSSFTNRIFINTNGNVGIANSAPGHTLSVTGTMNVSGNANVGNIGATNFVGSGASLTDLNASNISSGTVPTARLGSGTANANTYLAGDNTWKEINVSGSSISNGTSNVNIAASGGNITMGVGGTANVVTVTSSNVQIGTGSGGNISGANVITANRIGVVTTSPGYALDIQATDTTAGLGYGLRIRSNATATAAAMQFTNSPATAQNGLIAVSDTGIMTLQADGANSYIAFRTNGDERFRIANTGAITSSDLADAVGYKGLPQNAKTAQYTLALSDMGEHISITTGGVIIPANGSVAFPIGATIVVFNNSASTQTISITTDTLRLAGTTTTGTRTLAAYGIATLLKVAATVWVVTGNIT